MTAAKAIIAAAILIAGLAACGSPTWPAAGMLPAASQPGDRAGTTSAMSSPTAAAGTRQAAKPAIPPPGPVQVHDADPTAVARAVVITTNQFDTRTDTSRLDALRRAGRWLTPALLTGLLAVPSRPGAAWMALVARRGYTTVDHIELANEYGQPADTPDLHYIQISYHVHELGPNGWRGSNAGPELSRLQLVKLSGDWKVKAFD